MPVGKVLGAGLRGSALIKRANRLGVKHAELKNIIKDSRYRMIDEGILVPFCGMNALEHSNSPLSATLAGIAALVCGTAFCFNLRNLLEAYKEKRKIKHEMDDLMKNPNLKDAVNQKLGSEKGAELPTTTKEALEFFKEIYA